MLLDRLPERAALSELLDAARAGRSGVLVMRGEPGVGKTALLEYAVESAAGLRVVRVAGVESEMELAFAALQQLCAPMLDKLDGPAGSAACRAGRRVRPDYGGGAGPVSGGAGRAQPAVGGGGAAAAVVRDR